jgi:ABC-2 type transport system ATP-binding protein
MTAAVTVRDMSFYYPGQREPALRGIGFDVAWREVLGVLGPNGSGKTTLLAALLKIRHGRCSGQVLLDGKPPGRDSSVGYAAQEVALYRQLTTRENLEHVARLRLPRRQAAAAVTDAIEEYGLASVAGTQVHRLSGGWRRLVHVAVSFVHRPAIRLLDEPTAALDFEARARLLQRIKAWREQDVTTLVTSHYPEDIEELCGSVVLLDHGTVVNCLRLADLLGRDQPMLQVEYEQAGDRVLRTVPTPRSVGELATVMPALTDGIEPSAPLTDLRLVRNTMRDYLTAERPETGLLDATP